MATPAEVANDMAAHARYWQKRDAAIFRVCEDASRLIRMYLDGQKVDGRTYGGLHRRLLDQALRLRRAPYQGVPDLDRARAVLERLRSEAGQ